MVSWFKEFYNVNSSKFRGSIWIHSGLNELNAKKYWSELTGIPLEQFYKTYVVDRKEKSVRKNLHSFGVFTLYVSDVSILRQIVGSIAGIVGKA